MTGLRRGRHRHLHLDRRARARRRAGCRCGPSFHRGRLAVAGASGLAQPDSSWPRPGHTVELVLVTLGVHARTD